MMGSIMDLSSFVLEYVIYNEICERVIGLKHVTSTSGQAFLKLYVIH